MKSVRLVLFDLDGTLVDTAPDLAAALNALRSEHGLAPLPFAAIRPAVSHGSPALLHTGFGITPDSPDYPALRERLLALYETRLCVESRLFDGMTGVLDAIERRGFAWGVVTNKPGWLTEPLLRHLALAPRTACVVSGDTTERRKPHPDPLLYASRTAGIEPGACVYVGDAERDIRAGRAAGMHTVAARYGYLAPDDHPESWGADLIIDRPRELLDWLDRGSVAPA